MPGPELPIPLPAGPALFQAGSGLPLTYFAAAAGPCRRRRSGCGGRGGAGRCCCCPETLASPAGEGRGAPGRGGGCAAAAVAVGAAGRARHAALRSRRKRPGAGAAARSHAGPGALSRPRRRPAQWRRRGGYRRQPLCPPGALRDGDALPWGASRAGLCAGMRGAAAGTPLLAAGRNAALRPCLPAAMGACRAARRCCNVMMTGGFALRARSEAAEGFPWDVFRV